MQIKSGNKDMLLLNKTEAFRSISNPVQTLLFFLTLMQEALCKRKLAISMERPL